MISAQHIIEDAGNVIKWDFEAVCKTKMAKEVMAVAPGETDSNEVFFLGAVTEPDCTVIAQPDSDEDWRVTLPVNGSPVEFKIDTGANITVVNQSTYNRLPQTPRLVRTQDATSPGGEVRCIGKFLASSQYKGQKYAYWVTVIKGPFAQNLLGGGVVKRMGLVKRVNAVNTEVFSDIFGEMGLLKCDLVRIELKPDAEPYVTATSRRVPFPLLPKVEAELKRMLALGVIGHVTEPTDWCAPIVSAEKKNKDEVRVCVDLKRLNKAVKWERYMLPTLEDITPKLAGAKVFSSLDASSGFWQIPLDPSSQKLTTFITPMGRFCFKCLPFHQLLKFSRD